MIFNSACAAFSRFFCSPTSQKIKFDKKDFHVMSYAIEMLIFKFAESDWRQLKQTPLTSHFS